MKIIRLSNMAGFTSAPLNSFSIFRVKHYFDEDIKYAAFQSIDEKLIKSIKRDPSIRKRLTVLGAGGSIINYFNIVRKWGKDNRYLDLVAHGHQPGSSVVGLIALSFINKRIPFIYTVHNSMQNFPLIKKLLLFICFLRADKITFVSLSAFDSFKSILSKRLLEKSLVIQNGVDLERIDIALGEPEFKSQSRDGFINIACIGRLAPQKNLHFLIKIVAQLPSNVRLEIFGEGSLRDNIQNQIDKAGLQDRVVLRGNIPRDELFRLLNHSDLYVSVAGYEGLPMALMEALAIGKPCLASDIESHQEVQCLVPTLELIPFDEFAWVDAIQRFISTDSRERLQIGKSNRAFVRESLSMQRMQDRYRDLYEEVIHFSKETV